MAGEGPAAFAYSRALAPPMWAFAAIVALELAVVHLLLAALGHHLLAWILSALSLATFVWVIRLIRSFGRRPVLVDADGVTMQLGNLKTLHVPAASIAGLRTSWASELLKDRGVLNLAMINYPNVMLDLDPPLAGKKRPIHAVAHRLDDPAAFIRAVNGLMEARA